jgi:phosphoserine aminotransferase
VARIFNFSAGPATLPLEVLQQIQEEMLDWNATGASVMEVSHRGKPFMEMAAEAEQDARDLLGVPDNYKVLFLQGGAQIQFASVPLNLMGDAPVADYVCTGSWSKKAIGEAKRFCDVNVVLDTESSHYTDIPPQSEWSTRGDAAFLHYCSNETIGGVEFNWLPETGDVPLVCDMSSNFMSRPVDVSRYGLIYAGAQKNIGPAGITMVIVRDDLLGKTSNQAPSLFNYEKQAGADSMMNTVPTFCWYVCGLVFKWLIQNGGLEAMEQVNIRKAAKLYDFIDRSGGFYTNPVEMACRSRMNVPFIFQDNNLDAKFLAQSHDAGLHSLKGHRSVGGMRASIYNAMPEAGVDALIAFMQDFQDRNG